LDPCEGEGWAPSHAEARRRPTCRVLASAARLADGKRWLAPVWSTNPDWTSEPNPPWSVLPPAKIVAPVVIWQSRPRPPPQHSPANSGKLPQSRACSCDRKAVTLIEASVAPDLLARAKGGRPPHPGVARCVPTLARCAPPAPGGHLPGNSDSARRPRSSGHHRRQAGAGARRPQPRLQSLGEGGAGAAALLALGAALRLQEPVVQMHAQGGDGTASLLAWLQLQGGWGRRRAAMATAAW